MKVTFKGTFIIGSHSGYCSGQECEDQKSKFVQSVIIDLEQEEYDWIREQQDQTPDFDLKALFSDRIEQYLLTISGGYGGQSGYCGVSESGLHHEFVVRKAKVKKIELDSSHHDSRNYPCSDFGDIVGITTLTNEIGIIVSEIIANNIGVGDDSGDDSGDDDCGDDDSGDDCGDDSE